MPETIIVLILLMIVGAVIAIETTNLLYAVISIGAVGFLLSIVFLFLAAPDLAITQIAVEVITLVLLLRATSGATPEVVSRERQLGTRLAALAMVALLAVFSVRMFGDFREFGSPVMDQYADAPSNSYLRNGLEKTGAPNIVTAILLDFRAYDTLGEATVLFCAVLGAQTILRRKTRKQTGEADAEVEL